MALPKKLDVDWVNSLSDDEVQEYQQRLNAPQNLQSSKPTEDRTFLGTLGDIGVSAAKGVVGAGEAAVGLANIPTLGRAGKFVKETIGYDSEATQDYLSSLYSDPQQAASKRVSEAKGFLPTLGTALQNPSTIVHSVIESLPAMVGGGLLARGLLKAGAPIGHLTAGAIGEGAVAGGMMAEDVRQQSDTGTITGTQAAMSVGAGIGTGVFGIVGARAAKALGVGDIDTWLAGGKLGPGVAATKAVKAGAESSVKNQKGVINRIITGGITEGIFEELPQSMQEQVWMNAATDKPLGDGVGEAAALGMLAGGLMGGSLSIFTQPDIMPDKTKGLAAQPGKQAAAEEDLTPEEYLTPEELAEINTEIAALERKRAEIQSKKEVVNKANISTEEKKAAQAELTIEEQELQAEEEQLKNEFDVRIKEKEIAHKVSILDNALKNDYVGTMERLVNNPELLAALPIEVQEKFIRLRSEPLPTLDLVSKLLTQNQRALDSEAYMLDEPFEVLGNDFAALSSEEQEQIIRRERSVLALIKRQKEIAAQQPRKSLKEIESDAALDRFTNRIESHLPGFIEIADQAKAEIPILEGPAPDQVIPINYGEPDPRKFDPFDKITQRLGGKVFPRPQDIEDANFTVIDRQLRGEDAIIDPDVNLNPSEETAKSAKDQVLSGADLSRSPDEQQVGTDIPLNIPTDQIDAPAVIDYAAVIDEYNKQYPGDYLKFDGITEMPAVMGNRPPLVNFTPQKGSDIVAATMGIKDGVFTVEAIKKLVDSKKAEFAKPYHPGEVPVDTTTQTTQITANKAEIERLMAVAANMPAGKEKNLIRDQLQRLIVDNQKLQVENDIDIELSDVNNDIEAADTNQEIEEVAFTKAGLQELKAQAKAAYVAGDLELPQYMFVLDLLTQHRGDDVQKILNLIYPPAGGNLAQATKIHTASREVDLAKMLKMFGGPMYEQELVGVTIKETVQNSFDAVKASLNTKGPKGIQEGKISIIVDSYNRIVAIRDNGQGMDKNVILKKLFSLGGTDKSGLASGDASGSFGMAKAVFIYGNEWIECVTNKNGRRFSFKARGDFLVNNDPPITEDVSNDPNAHGTTFVIKIPEYTIDMDSGEKIYVPFPNGIQHLSFFQKPLISPNLEITVSQTSLTDGQIENLAQEGSTVWQEKDSFRALPIGKYFNFENFQEPTKIKFSWGSADFYLGKKRKIGWLTKHTILSAGVFQFNHQFKFDNRENVPYDIMINIFPTVKAESPRYPFDVKREGFKALVANDVTALTSYLRQIAYGIEATETVEQFKNIKALPKVDFDDLGTNRIDIQDFIIPKKEPSNKDNEISRPKNIQVKDGQVVGKNSKGKKIVLVDLGQETAKRNGNLIDSSMTPEKDIPKAKDFLIDVGIDDSKPIFHNNTTADYFAVAKEAGYSAEEFFSELGSVLIKIKEIIRDKKLYNYSVLSEADRSVFTGISIDKGYHGANLVVPFQAILLNPLALKSKTLPGIVFGYYNTILHEFAHIPQRNHEKYFIAEMDELGTKLAEDGTDLEIKVTLARIAKKHQKLINLLRDTYESSTTKNIAKSLTEGDSSDGLAARRVADGPDGESTTGYGTRTGNVLAETGQETDSGIPTGTENTAGNVTPNVSELTTPSRDIPQEEYDRVFAQRRGVLSRLRQFARINKTDIKHMLDKIGAPISTRLAKISPLLSSKVRWLDFNTMKAFTEDLQAALPVMNAIDNMSAQDKSAWDWAVKQRDINRIDFLTEKHGFKEAYQKVRNVLDKIHTDAEDVGLAVGYLNNYWPRILKDQEGFLQDTREISQRGDFTDALKAKAKKLGTTVDRLDPSLKADIIGNIILSGHTGIGGPGATQKRVFDIIPEEYAKYYMDSGAALMQYVYSMRTAIEARRFFGRVPERIKRAQTKVRAFHSRLVNLQDMEALMVSDGQDATKIQAQIEELQDNIKLHQEDIEVYRHKRDFTENIDSYISELLTKEVIKEDQENTVKDILNARFHEKGTHGIVNLYKNFAYIDTMGNPFSAITQIGDLAWSYYVGGLTPVGITRTTKNLIKAIFNKSEITKEAMGIQRIAQEFADVDTMSNAVAWVFKRVGLEKIDAIGKETLINTAYDNYKARAESITEQKKLREEIRPLFGNETNKVIEDLLANNKASRNVQFLVFNKLLDFQPVAKSEMSEIDLKAGNARIFFMLKKFTLKTIDIYRRESFQKMKSNDPKEVITGITNMIKLAGLFTLANAGADELKDLLAGKESKFEDNVIENLLTMGGASKYMQMQVRSDGAGSAFLGQILPPFKFIDSLSRDAFGDTSEGLRTVDSIPFVGKLYYWHAGRGSERRPTINEQEFTKLKKETGKFKKDFEDSKDKRLFLQSNIAQFRQMKLVDTIQGSLNKNKTLINKLNEMKQTINIQKRVAQLKQQRELILENFFKRQN